MMQKIAHAIFATPSRVWASVFRNLKVKQRRGSCEKMLMHRIHAERVLFSLPLSSIDVVRHFRFFVVNEVWARHHVKANDNASAPSLRWPKQEPRKEGGEA